MPRTTGSIGSSRSNISNLAGVPSIIYGIFGLALFVRLVGFGYTLLSGALTLALLIIPIVIIATIEALKAVPEAQREGAYALGASRWQMVRGSVLPAAAPGIMTGVILAMARAIGEAAPLLIVGAFTFVTFIPTPLGGYTVLPGPDLRLGGPAAGGLPEHRRGGDPRHPRVALRPEPAGDHPPHPPVEAHPMVEGAPVTTHVDDPPANEAVSTEAVTPAADGEMPTIHLDLTARHASSTPETERRTALSLRHVSCYYGAFRAVNDVSLEVAANQITALIGPSGCGKSTLLRTINRMNDLVPGYRTEGHLLFDGEDLYGPGADPVAIRRRVGMVFQKPNPFPKSIFDNVAFGPRINGYTGNIADLVEESLHRAALWNEVKDKLKHVRHGALRRPAAASLYRPGDRDLT